MSSFHATKFRDAESRRGTIRNALDEQIDYEQVRFRWLFGFIHVRHFFALIQVVVLYVFTPFLLLCGSASQSCPSALYGENLPPAVQALFLLLGVIVIICVVFSSVAFHWTEKLRYMNFPYHNDRFCHLSPMPFVALFFFHQIFMFALLIFYLYSSLFSGKFTQLLKDNSFTNLLYFITGGILPFVLFMALMVYIMYGDFRLWSYACFVREHTKLKRRLAKIDEERGYKSGLTLGNFSRISKIGSHRSLSDVIGSNSIRAKIQRYRQSLSRNSITSDNSFAQNSLRQKPAHLAERMDEAGDNPLPHVASFASSNEQSLNESRESRGRRFAPRTQYNALATQSPPSSLRLQRNPVYTTTDNSDIELMHVLDTIGEVPEENHSG